MPNTLTNATLSNKRNRQRSVEPEVSNYLQFIDTLYDDLEFVIGNLNKYKDKYYQGMKDNSKQGEPPRLYRRVIYLSQAAMPDRIKLS